MINIFKNSTYKKLAIVQFLIYFGSFFSMVAIYTFVIELKATSIQIAITTTSFLIPSLFGFLTGAIVDKYLTKNFMAITLFLEAIFSSLVLFINSIEEFWLLILFIIFRSTCSFIFFASQMTLFPQIAKNEKELQNLNTLHSIIWSLNFALGMSLGGIVVTLIGVKGAILIDVSLFILAFLIFLNINLEIISSTKESIINLVKSGIKYLKNNSLTLKLMLLHSSVALTNFDTIVNLLAKSQYTSVIALSLSIGLINGIRAIALLIGATFFNKYINKDNLEYFLILQGVFIIIWAIFQMNFYTSLFSIFFVGLFTAILWSYTYTLMQLSVKQEYLGRVVAYSDTLFMIVSMSVSFFSGYFYEQGFSLKSITISLGIGFFIFSIYYKYLKKYVKYLF